MDIVNILLILSEGKSRFILLANFGCGFQKLYYLSIQPLIKNIRSIEIFIQNCQ